jgi:hypothetical protein
LRLLLQSIWVPSIATVLFECFLLLLLLLHTHYMFRSLRPSSGGTYILVALQGAIFLQRIRSCLGYQLCVYIYIYIYIVLAIFSRCQYVCGGYDPCEITSMYVCMYVYIYIYIYIYIPPENGP